MSPRLADVLPIPDDADLDTLLDVFTDWASAGGRPLYPAQEEAILEIYSGANVVLATPTGSGKSLVALAAHVAALAEGRRTFYTAPIKALVSEKFFDLCHELGSDQVGMLTGDAAVNADAPVICCTAEILANLALREGEAADVGQVVMDEFHYYADPDRGWAWQVPLLTLPQAQFVLMSATLGDTRRFERELTERTGRPTAAVRGVERPVPLTYEYRRTPMHETIDDVLARDLAPVYVVHFTHASAVERAQALMSINMCSREEKDAIADAIGGFRFGAGFGRSLSRYVRHGIGVHHAGMLPKYRRLVERLAQEGHLKVICGTDTLGVGINVPIRTVLLTQLAKYDGTTTRLLSAREFHQIAGRAGRAGYDTAGHVWAQAPDHVIENERALAKAGDDAKKKRKLVKSKPPQRGYVPWSEDTFDKLVAAPPEALTSSFAVSHSMLLNVLDRPGDGCGAMRRLLVDNHDPRPQQRTHIRRAISMYRSLGRAGVVEQLDEPDDRGRLVRVTIDLQADFALNQPLSPFVLHAIGHLDREAETYPLDVLSLVESVLENPGVVLAAQLDKLRGETIERLKREGVEYEQRMEELEKLEHPKPLRDLTYGLFNEYAAQHPWVADHNIRPKSVARDLYERAMTFADYVRHYGLARSEGLLLRYLGDAYKGLVQNVPEEAKTDEVYDLTEWLGELVRQVDSSLLDEWEELRHPEEMDPEHEVPPTRRLDEGPGGLTRNERAFTVMVRNEMFRWVELLARRAHDELAERLPPRSWTADALSEAMAPYWDAHDAIGIGPDARSADLLRIESGDTRWRVRQTLDDPAGNRDWTIRAEVDLGASDEEGHAVVHLLAIDDAP
ncbi:DEAD/DEAH box helicase [Actinomarinicola tropica]|uniref:DEAD/DEAH box helicase n=1 Tax=Actinomarinicola tropica TaxID=2789776 RepID=UPI0038993843